MDETQFIQTIIQGGGIGISVMLIIYSGWKDKLYNRTINNHIQHFTEAFEKNTEVIRRNTEAQTKLYESHKRTGKIMERVENKLDKL